MIAVDASFALKLFLNELDSPQVRQQWQVWDRDYDCCYLALAAMTNCDLWTADRRLVKAVGASLAWVRTP